MREKISLGSIIVVLLMLVSTQIVFFETAESSLTPHTGDADVGDIWNSELDVSSVIRTFDDIGIAHVSASDDMVIWGDKKGNITADWDVDIDSHSHPEFFVAFSLYIYNVETENALIGNDTFMKTYNANTDYDESGTLSVSLDFSGEQLREVTLLCYLGASFIINDTSEAQNFTSVAKDRCVVVVFLTSNEAGPPPDIWDYRNRANQAFPCMWSWIDDWELKFQFNENLMMNNQTFFILGWNTTSEYTQPNDPWWLGNVTINILGWKIWTFEFEEEQTEKYWEFNNGWALGHSYMNYSISPMPGSNPAIVIRYILFMTERVPWNNAMEHYLPARKTWIKGLVPNEGKFGAPLRISEYYDKNGDDIVRLDGFVWAQPLFGVIPLKLDFLTNYQCHIAEEGDNTQGSGGMSYYWEEDCVYMNSTEADVDSSAIGPITYIDVNISSFLLENECIYTWRGYTGDTRINILCEE